MNHELVCRSVIAYSESKSFEFCLTIGNGFTTKVVQIFKCIRFIIVNIDKLLGERNLFFFRISILNLRLQLGKALLDRFQPLHCFVILVNVSKIFFNLFAGTAATTIAARTTFEALERGIFQRLERSNLTVDLSNRFFVGRDIQFKL